MGVSVIVPTYRRPESLARCLDALERQEQPAEEVLVVVRDADPASAEVAHGRGGSVRVVPVRRPGVVAAMNAGLDACASEIVALTDDDSAPHGDWLRRIASAYASAPEIGAVGGRDWVYAYRTGQLIGGSARVVGRVDWLGRLTGNHHLGCGEARDVEVLKGVNLSVRADLLREIRFDERLRGVGTEHHWELALCLTLRRRGWRVVYDPAIGVDHYPQPRVEDSRSFNPDELRDARHNETVAVLEHLPAWRGPLHLAWGVVLGTRAAPGLVLLVRSLPNRDGGWSRFRGAQAGLIDGLATYRRSLRAFACPPARADDSVTLGARPRGR